MNNQDFKKLLRESIEARTDELEEGILDKVAGKIKSWWNTPGPDFSNKANKGAAARALKGGIEKEIRGTIEAYNKENPENPKKHSDFEIGQYANILLKNINITAADKGEEEIAKLAKEEIKIMLGIFPDRSGVGFDKAPAPEDTEETGEDEETDDPYANASEDFLDPKVNAKSISTSIMDWARAQIFAVTNPKSGTDAKKESIKFIQSLNLILKKQDPETFKQYLENTFKQQGARKATNTKSGGSSAWAVIHPKNLDRLSLDNFKKLMNELAEDPKLSIYFKIIGSLPVKESKKNTLRPRLHESLRRERDEEIYNKLMKRLNNQ